MRALAVRRSPRSKLRAMDSQHSFLLTIHIVSFGVWLGNLFAIAATLVERDVVAEAGVKTVIAELAKKMARVADIGATITLVGGVGLISTAPGYYLHQPWLHMKLTLVVGLLGVHGFLRMKVKRATQGQGTFPRPILGMMMLLAVGIVALAVFKPLQR